MQKLTALICALSLVLSISIQANSLQPISSDCFPEAIEQTSGGHPGLTKADHGVITFIAGILGLALFPLCFWDCHGRCESDDMRGRRAWTGAFGFLGLMASAMATLGGFIMWNEHEKLSYKDEKITVTHEKYFRSGMDLKLTVADENELASDIFDYCWAKKLGPSDAFTKRAHTGETIQLAEPNGPGHFRYNYNIMKENSKCGLYRFDRLRLNNGYIEFTIEDGGPFHEASAQVKEQYPLNLLEYEVRPDLTTKKRCSTVTHFAYAIDREPTKEDLQAVDTSERTSIDVEASDLKPTITYRFTVQLPSCGEHIIHMLSKESDGTFKRASINVETTGC